MYINDLTENLRCNVKLFADDTSFFTVVHDPDAAALDMNHDLNLIKLWTHNWRMSFNPDPAKQAVEVTFSRKRINVDHPRIQLNDTPVLKVEEHKHLGIVLDSRLSFARHIQAIITKSRQGIGSIQISTTDGCQVTFSKVLLILTTGTHASENPRKKFQQDISFGSGFMLD